MTSASRFKWVGQKALIFFKRLVWLAILAYGLGSLAALILLRTISDHFSPVGFLSYVIQFILPPALILLPLCLIWRRWLLAATLLPAVAAFVWLYGGLFLPTQADARPAGPQLAVMTFNIDKDADSYTQIFEIIRTTDADIVAVQEIQPDTAEQIEAEFADLYSYMALHPQAERRSRNDDHLGRGQGVGILSRYPILEDDYVQLERDYQRIVIDVNGTPIALYNVHLVQPLATRPGRFHFEDHTSEVNAVLARAESETIPVILAGDFNMTDQTDDYQLVADQYADTFREVGRGMGFTYPGKPKNPFNWIRLPNMALLRIDYIFHDDYFSVFEVDVMDSGGADHRPILARFVMDE